MSSSRKRSKDRVNLAVGGAALAAAIAAIVYFGAPSVGVPVPDQFGCYADLEQPRTAVWVDVSGDRFDIDQIRSLNNFFFEELELGLNEGLNEGLDVYTSEEDVQTSIMKPRFHVCGIARNGQELIDAGLPAMRNGFLERLREKQRKDILEPELGAIFSAHPDPSRLQEYQSPILEAIHGIAREGLKRRDRLIIVSDLLQNSESARFCTVRGDMPRFAAFKEKSIYGRLAPRSLDGVEVTVLMLLREGYGQASLPYCNSEEELKTFFADYFADNGASAEFIRLRQGVGGM